MQKIDLEKNDKVTNEFISHVKKYITDYEVNANNVLDFDKLLFEKNNCKNCNGLSNCKNQEMGYCYSFDGNYFYYESCKYKKQEEAKLMSQDLINTFYLSKKVLEANLESYDLNSESRNKIYKHIIEFKTNYDNGTLYKGLYLYGTFSIGKTYTLAVLANELAKYNIKSLLIYFPDLIVDLKNAVVNDRDRYEKLINMLKTIDVLMLDDFGSENMSTWVRDEILGPIINYRLADGKPLYISSNLRPNELKDHLIIDNSSESKLKAERLMSRLNGLLYTISMDDSKIYKR